MSDVPFNDSAIQLEATTARSPLSESLIQAIGGAINRALRLGPAVGTVEMSDLDEATFVSIKGNNWVLCDGRAVVGSRYQALTSLANVPDRRGTFPRMKDHGRGLDPHGEQAVGTYQADQTQNHDHQVNPIQGDGNRMAPGIYRGHELGDGQVVFSTQIATRFVLGYYEAGILPNLRSSAFGGTESNSKAVITNFFVRIN